MIEFLGWVFAVILCLALLLLLIYAIGEVVYKSKEKAKEKYDLLAREEMSRQLNTAVNWLNGPHLFPISEIVGYISFRIREGGISGDFLRDKILDIMKSGRLSDGYHTHEELYKFRLMYNAAFFNELSKQGETSWVEKEIETIPITHQKHMVHKSLRHHDGQLCFGGGYFIVVAELPQGQITNHYPIEHWDLFKIPEETKALFEWDGHTSSDVLDRIELYINSKDPSTGSKVDPTADGLKFSI